MGPKLDSRIIVMKNNELVGDIFVKSGNLKNLSTLQKIITKKLLMNFQYYSVLQL